MKRWSPITIALFLCIALTSFKVGATELYLASVTTHPYIPAPGSINLTITGYISSPDTVTEFICHTFDGQATFTDTISASIPYGMSFAPFTATLSTFHNLTSGEVKHMTIWVETTGDTNPLNDTVRYTLYGLSFIPDKVVVLEEGQATGCPWCTRGYVMMDSMAEKYGNSVATVGVHTSFSVTDPMAFTPYSSWIWGRLPSGIPGATIDRAVNNVSTIHYDTTISDRKNLAPPAAIQASCSINSSSSEITINIDVEMAATFSGDYRVNAIVVENSVTGTTPDYNQTNAYANGANGPMGIYSTLPNPVPASQMVYERVARALAGGIEGDAGSLPTLLPVNSNHSYQYIVSLDSVVDPTHLEVIALFLDGTSGQILNAAKWPVSTWIDSWPDASFSIFPNPASDLAYLHLNLQQEATVVVSVLDIRGRLVAQRNYGSLQGQQLLPIITDRYEDGPYIVMVSIDGGTKSLPLIVSGF